MIRFLALLILVLAAPAAAAPVLVAGDIRPALDLSGPWHWSVDPYRDGVAGFHGEVPDPQDVESFERSRLSPREPEQLYLDLLRLRRELPRELDVAYDEDARTLTLRRGRATLHADFARELVSLDA